VMRRPFRRGTAKIKFLFNASRKPYFD